MTHLVMEWMITGSMLLINTLDARGLMRFKYLSSFVNRMYIYVSHFFFGNILGKSVSTSFLNFALYYCTNIYCTLLNYNGHSLSLPSYCLDTSLVYSPPCPLTGGEHSRY